jgi:hypothetical protein
MCTYILNGCVLNFLQERFIKVKYVKGGVPYTGTASVSASIERLDSTLCFSNPDIGILSAYFTMEKFKFSMDYGRKLY